MKRKSSVTLRCNLCFFVKYKKRLSVNCIHLKHKVRQK